MVAHESAGGHFNPPPCSGEDWGVFKAVGAQGSAAVNLGEVVSKALGECVSVLFDVDRYHDNVARHGCVCVCWI